MRAVSALLTVISSSPPRSVTIPALSLPERVFFQEFQVTPCYVFLLQIPQRLCAQPAVSPVLLLLEPLLAAIIPHQPARLPSSLPASKYGCE